MGRLHLAVGTRYERDGRACVYVGTADEAGGAWQRLVLSQRMRRRATEGEAKGRLCHRG